MAKLSQRKTEAALVAIAVVAAIPRVLLSLAHDIEYDGWSHVFVARQTRLADFWAEAAATTHPPLHYALLFACAKLGHGRVAYNAVSILSGVLCVYLIGRIASRIASPTTALFAASTLALSRMAVELSSSVRSYMLALTFLAWSYYGFVGIFGRERDTHTRDPWYFFAGACLALASHNFSVFYVAATIPTAGVVILLGDPSFRRTLVERFRRHRVALFTGSAALAAILVILYFLQLRPWSAPLDFLSAYYRDPRRDSSLAAFLWRGAAEDARIFAPFGLPGGPVLVAILLAVICWTLLELRSAARSGDSGAAPEAAAPAMFLWIALLLLAAAAVGRYPLGGAMRHQSIVLPFGILAVAVALHRLAKRFPTRASSIWTTAFMLVVLNAVYQTVWFQSVQFQVEPTPIQEEAASALRGARISRDIYADQFSFTPLFAAFSNAEWRRLPDRPGLKGVLQYEVRAGGFRRIVHRDTDLWNADLTRRPSLERLARVREGSGAPCMTTFHVDQSPSDVRKAEVELREVLDVHDLRKRPPFWVFTTCGS